MRHALEPAFILHSRPYRDTSLLLEIISRTSGRLALVARGAKRGRRTRLAGMLQVFHPLLLSWSGRGDILTLNQVEEAGPPYRIPAPRSLCALYANELLLRLLRRQDAFPELFGHYHHLLAMLSGDDDEEPHLRLFEKQLIEQIGYGLLLHLEAGSAKPVNEDKTYRYEFGVGPVAVDAEDNRDGHQNKTTGVCISGAGLLALHHEALTVSNPAIRKEIKILMRAALAEHLDDKPLKTRQLAAAYRRQSGRPILTDV